MDGPRPGLMKMEVLRALDADELLEIDCCFASERDARVIDAWIFFYYFVSGE